MTCRSPRVSALRNARKTWSRRVGRKQRRQRRVLPERRGRRQTRSAAYWEAQQRPRLRRLTAGRRRTCKIKSQPNHLVERYRAGRRHVWRIHGGECSRRALRREPTANGGAGRSDFGFDGDSGCRREAHLRVRLRARRRRQPERTGARPCKWPARFLVSLRGRAIPLQAAQMQRSREHPGRMAAVKVQAALRRKPRRPPRTRLAVFRKARSVQPNSAIRCWLVVYGCGRQGTSRTRKSCALPT